jgi:carbon-monoxide dehydrogenase small subunit
VQKAFVDAGAVQCGFCTPGFVISTVALLRANPEPSDAEIREALAGNICRCTGYGKILEAVHVAAKETYRQ